jgi:hypothetical protein
MSKCPEFKLLKTILQETFLPKERKKWLILTRVRKLQHEPGAWNWKVRMWKKVTLQRVLCLEWNM